MGSAKDIAYLTQAFHCQLRLHQMEMAVRQAGDHAAAAREDLKRFWPHARRAFDWCAERLDSDLRAAVACDKIAGVAGQLFEHVFGRHQLIQWREVAARGAEIALASGRMPDTPEYDMVNDLLGHLTYLGYLHFANGNMGSARQVLGRALKVGEEHGRHFADTTAWLHLAFVAITENQLDEAEALLTRALTVAGDENEANLRTALGVTLGRRERNAEAVEQYDRVVTLSEARGDRGGLCTALINRAGAQLDLGKTDAASDDLDRADALAAQLASPGHLGLLNANRARLEAHRHPDDGARVLDMLQTALDNFDRVGDRVQRGRIAASLEAVHQKALASTTAPPTPAQRLRSLAALTRLAGDRGDAEQSLVWARQLHAAHEAVGDSAGSLLAQAEVIDRLVALGRHAEARPLAEAALDALRSWQPGIDGDTAPALDVELQSLYGQCLRNASEPDSAARAFEAGLAAAERAGNEDAALGLRGNLGLAWVDQGRHSDGLKALRGVQETLRDGNDYRVLGLACFNVAYALHRQGQAEAARREAETALEILERIGDATAAEVRRQLRTWPPP